MGIYTVDCVFEPLKVGVEGGGGGVTVVEGYSDEEETRHAGIFVNETDAANPVIIVWKKSKD